MKNLWKYARRLEWPLDIPVILLVGGGEGMGPSGKDCPCHQ